MTFRLLKSLSFTTLIFVPLLSIAEALPIKGIWADSPVGKCYSSLEEYLVNTFGANYRNDEGIQVTDAFEGRLQYKWVRDITPRINITRVMFRLEEDRRACAILFIPFASTVTEIKDRSVTELPIKFHAFDSPAPGFPRTEILYQLDAKAGIYYPKQCVKHFSTGKKRKFNCMYAFQ